MFWNVDDDGLTIFAKFKGTLYYNIANLEGREFKRTAKTRFFLDVKLIGFTVYLLRQNVCMEVRCV